MQRSIPRSEEAELGPRPSERRKSAPPRTDSGPRSEECSRRLNVRLIIQVPCSDANLGLTFCRSRSDLKSYKNIAILKRGYRSRSPGLDQSQEEPEQQDKERRSGRAQPILEFEAGRMSRRAPGHQRRAAGALAQKYRHFPGLERPLRDREAAPTLRW